ncbi:MAG: helix-turn-helix domain-containing protein [Chloroflexota bacterium]
MGQVGDLLRSARQEKGVSLAQAEAATMIRRHYLQALEDDEPAGLPGTVYIKGFLRNYAIYLGLDPASVLSLYNREHREEATRAVYTQPSIRGRGTRQIVTGGTFAGILLVAVLAIFAVYAFRQVQTFKAAAPANTAAISTPTPVQPTATTNPAIAAASSMAVASPTPRPTPTIPPNTAEVTAKIRQDTWLQVSVDGKRAFEGVLRAGQTQTWKGKSVFIWAGNAGGVDIVFNGKNLGPLGTAGEVVKKNFKPTVQLANAG